MNIVVIGAGAVGGYYGARLSESGANVTFLVRNRRKEQIEQNGLIVQSVNGDYHLRTPNLETDVRNITECDLVILAVKGYHLQGTLETLDYLVKKGAFILPLLNGYEHYLVLQNKYGKERVLGGVCFIISTLNKKGHIIHTSKNDQMFFGTLHPNQTKVCNELSAYTSKANFTDKYADNILYYIWRKYAFIVAYSGMTTASRKPIGAVRENEASMKIYQDVALEMERLASAYGISLGDRFKEIVTEQIMQLPYESTSSMHQDLKKSLPLEVDHLQGGALRLAVGKGLKMPKTETLYGVIVLNENSSGNERK